MVVRSAVETTNTIVIDNFGADWQEYKRLEQMPGYPEMLRKAADLLEGYYGMLTGISVYSDDRGESLILKVHPFPQVGSPEGEPSR